MYYIHNTCFTLPYTSVNPTGLQLWVFQQFWSKKVQPFIRWLHKRFNKILNAQYTKYNILTTVLYVILLDDTRSMQNINSSNSSIYANNLYVLIQFFKIALVLLYKAVITNYMCNVYRHTCLFSEWLVLTNIEFLYDVYHVKFVWQQRCSNVGKKLPKLLKSSYLQAYRVDTSIGQCEARVLYSTCASTCTIYMC